MTRLVPTITVLLSIIFGLLTVEVVLRGLHHVKKSKSPLKGDPAAYHNENEFYGFVPTVAKLQYYSKAGYRPVPDWKEEGIQSNDFGARTVLTSNEINDLPEKRVVSGGSTAWGAGVKQSDLFVNRFAGISVGVGGYLLANEISLIREIVSKSIKIDYWMSFSGWNDVYAAYRGESFYVSPDMFNIEGLIYSSDLHPRFLRTSKAFLPTSTPGYESYKIKAHYIIDKALNALKKTNSNYVDKVVSDDVVLKKNATPMEYSRFWSFYRDDLIRAANWAKRNEIRFIFCLQPALYDTNKTLHPQERQLLREYTSKYPSLVSHFQSFYPKLRRDIKALSKTHGFLYIDGDTALSVRGDLIKMFVDYAHFGSKGNETIGKFLAVQFDQISRVGSP
ncbi:MAG: hypothetical protein VW307_03285 [Alphaproteobacteria bacterium]